MENTPTIFYLVPAASVVALIFAWLFYRNMKRQNEGTERMKEIAHHVRVGAMAYLRQQYKVVVIVFLVLAAFFAVLAYVLHVQNEWVPFAFLTGGLFSGLAGYFGMKTATHASARTAHAAQQSLNQGLKVAFRQSQSENGGESNSYFKIEVKPDYTYLLSKTGDKVNLSNGMAVETRIQYDKVTYFNYVMEALGVLTR